jgi:ubiquinone/menaquinone biosynthesis C-methylase UbiE
LKKDIQEWISPNTLWHIKRYEFARENLKGKKVLDVACGTGYGKDLLGDNIDYTGVDSDKNCIKYAKANFNGKYVRASIYTMPFPEGSFDTVISFETLEHLQYPTKALQNIFKILCVRGRLIVSIPMNHPDTIYHKEIYTYSKIRKLAEHITDLSIISEYMQTYTKISPIYGKLNDDSPGTYIGIWEKEGKK